jgi:hypothetical protein
MATADTTTCAQLFSRPSQPPLIAAAYRHLAVVVLGLDPQTLIHVLRAQRSSWTNTSSLRPSVRS